MQHCPACLTSGSLMGSEGGSNGLKRDGAAAPAHFTTCHPLSCRWGQEPHGAGYWREYTLLWYKHMHRETDTHKTRPSNLDPTSDPAVRCYNGIYHNLSPFRQNTTVTCSLSEQSTKGVYCVHVLLVLLAENCKEFLVLSQSKHWMLYYSGLKIHRLYINAGQLGAELYSVVVDKNIN